MPKPGKLYGKILVHCFPSSGMCLRSNSNFRSESGVGSVSSACWTIYQPENSSPARLDIQGHTQNYACFLRTIAHSCRFVLMLKFKRLGWPSAAVAWVVGIHYQAIGQWLRLLAQWVSMSMGHWSCACGTPPPLGYHIRVNLTCPHGILKGCFHFYFSTHFHKLFFILYFLLKKQTN